MKNTLANRYPMNSTEESNFFISTTKKAQLHVKKMVYERIEMLRLKRLDVLRAKLQEAAIVVLQRCECEMHPVGSGWLVQYVQFG